MNAVKSLSRRLASVSSFAIAITTAGLCCLAVCCFSGCNRGPTIVPVSGTVMMDGKPMTGAKGFIRIEPDNYRAAFGKINPEDGTFQLTTKNTGDGCITGQHKVAVIVNVSRGPKLITLIPYKYTETATSGLTANIEGATSTLEINLEGGLRKAPAAGADIYMGDDPGSG